MATKKATDNSIEITPIRRKQIMFYVLGTSPYLSNAMSAKAKQELLAPQGRKSTADRAASIKHNPLREFRESAYYLNRADDVTAIGVMATAFKSALRSAALDMPGSSKSQIGRLTYVVGDMVPLFGVPQLVQMVVRSSDINRTPDVRTRAIFPRWASIVTVDYVTPLLRETAVANLLAAAGITQGVGDGRPEKGKMSYGQFELVNPDNPEFNEIIRTGGRAAQIAALREPAYYDAETERLMGWFAEAARQRGYNLDDPTFEATFTETVEAT